MAIVKLRNKGYSTYDGAIKAVARYSVKYQPLRDMPIVIVAQDGAYHPVMLPSAEQVQMGITLSRVTPFVVMRT